MTSFRTLIEQAVADARKEGVPDNENQSFVVGWLAATAAYWIDEARKYQDRYQEEMDRQSKAD